MRPGNGICHYLHVERFARPGQLLIGADSHTTTSGCLGMIAIGAGGLDVAICMAGLPFEMETPRVVGVHLTGALAPRVQPKDVILELLRWRGVCGGLGRIFEFYGEGVARIGVTGRLTICNMIAELGATTGIFPADAHTRACLEAQGRGAAGRRPAGTRAGGRRVRAGGALLSAGPAHSAAVDQGSPITSPVPDEPVQYEP